MSNDTMGGLEIDRDRNIAIHRLGSVRLSSAVGGKPVDTQALSAGYVEKNDSGETSVEKPRKRKEAGSNLQTLCA